MNPIWKPINYCFFNWKTLLTSTVYFFWWAYIFCSKWASVNIRIQRCWNVFTICICVVRAKKTRNLYSTLPLRCDSTGLKNQLASSKEMQLKNHQSVPKVHFSSCLDVTGVFIRCINTHKKDRWTTNVCPLESGREGDARTSLDNGLSGCLRSHSILLRSRLSQKRGFPVRDPPLLPNRSKLIFPTSYDRPTRIRF